MDRANLNWISEIEDRVDNLRGAHQSLRDDTTTLYEDHIVPLEMNVSRLEKKVEELENE